MAAALVQPSRSRCNMRLPKESDRRRVLPERVLKEALARVGSYAEGMSHFFGRDREEMEEAAALGAWLAWETYDPAKRTLWRTWLVRHMNWMVMEAVREWGKARNKDYQEFHAQYSMFSVDDPATRRDDGGEMVMGDVVADPRQRPVEDQVLDRIEATELLAQLLPRERLIFRYRYMEERDKQAVASVLGVSKSRVSQYEAMARDRMAARNAYDAALTAAAEVEEARAEAAAEAERLAYLETGTLRPDSLLGLVEMAAVQLVLPLLGIPDPDPSLARRKKSRRVS